MKTPYLCVLLLALVACKSKEAPPLEPLPFHVAIKFNGVVSEGGSAGENASPEEKELEIVLDRVELVRELERVLLSQKVSAVTDLGKLKGDDADWDDARWVEAARRAGADLLLECGVVHRKTFESEKNDKFWLNLPLFALVGTLNLFVNDRTYSAEAALEGQIVDLNGVYEERTTLRRQRPLIKLDESFEDLSLDFVERDGHKGMTLLWSFFVPSGFLATRNSAVTTALNEGITRDLARRLAGTLQSPSGRRSLVNADSAYNFALDAEDWTARREGAEVVVTGVVTVLKNNFVQGMREWSLRCDTQAEPIFGDFGDADSEELMLTGVYEARYPFQARAPYDANAKTVKLTLVERSEDRISRSYTLPIE